MTDWSSNFQARSLRLELVQGKADSSIWTNINIEVKIHINTKLEAWLLELQVWGLSFEKLAAWVLQPEASGFRSLELQKLGAWSLRRLDLKLEELAACSFNLEAGSPMLAAWGLKLEIWNWKTGSLRLEACCLKLKAWHSKLETWSLKLQISSLAYCSRSYQ